jgi:hypothetical protein
MRRKLSIGVWPVVSFILVLLLTSFLAPFVERGIDREVEVWLMTHR